MKSHYQLGLLRQFVPIVVAIAAVGLFCPTCEAQRDPPPTRYKFTIESATPMKDLLPAPPRTLPILPPYLNEDPALAAELTFGEPVATNAEGEKATAHIIAKINHLNKQDADGFLKSLTANRADLRGLPFLMGNDCRTEEKQALLFSETVEVVRRLSRNIAMQEPEAASIPNDQLTAAIIFREFPKALTVKGLQRRKASQPEVDRAHVASLMQMFGPLPPLYRVGLAKYLATIEHIDATQALAKLAVFAHEESVQKAAIDGLKGRPTKDFANVLMQGFRYPLPAVSKRAADALVKLKCNDLLADLVNVLDQPDPRAPAKQQLDGKEVTAVRELVRVNHRRNCLLCHAPANTEDVPENVLTVPVPLPTQASEGYYFRASPDIFVRTDVTYLRQDFSMVMRVENAAPWPEMQRFDFLVRTRVLSAEEASECAKQMAKQGTPPSHIAAGYALRELTGRDPEAATPEAWRRELKLAQR